MAGRHGVVAHGVSAYSPSVTEEVLAASGVGESAGATAARAAGLGFRVVDAGTASGDLVTTDAMPAAQVCELLERGRSLGEAAGQEHGLLALGEVGIGNTTVAAALAAVLLDVAPPEVVGLGAGADTAMLARKAEVVAVTVTRLERTRGGEPLSAEEALACAGGPEFCVLAGAVLGAASVNAVTVLDGLATSVAALVAVRMEPGASAYLIAGQRSRERGHDLVLDHLGLEPLLDLRVRAGEGVGAALAASMMISGLMAEDERSGSPATAG